MDNNDVMMLARQVSILMNAKLTIASRIDNKFDLILRQDQYLLIAADSNTIRTFITGMLVMHNFINGYYRSDERPGIY